jgi:hypothetical protein
LGGGVFADLGSLTIAGGQVGNNQAFGGTGGTGGNGGTGSKEFGLSPPHDGRARRPWR